MPGKERRKQVERERYQRQVARRIRRDERNRVIKSVVASVAIVVVVVGGFSFLAYRFATDNDKPEAAPTKETPTESKKPSQAEANPNRCAYKEVPAEMAKGGQLKNVGTPPAKKVKKDRKATINTNRGQVKVSLYGKKAPCTVGSFKYLADKKFFDDTQCHRVVDKQIFVLQCGKPAGKAQGPTYQYATENPGKYTKGTLAMANSGQPNTNGSQFFIVYKNSPLPAQYTVFGKVDVGLDMVAKVGKAGPTKEDPQVGGGPPKKKVKVNKVTVR